jgi:hypothetical protein
LYITLSTYFRSGGRYAVAVVARRACTSYCTDEARGNSHFTNAMVIVIKDKDIPTRIHRNAAGLI